MIAYLVTEENYALIARVNGGVVPTKFSFDTYFITATVDDYDLVVSADEFKQKYVIRKAINAALGRYLIDEKE